MSKSDSRRFSRLFNRALGGLAALAIIVAVVLFVDRQLKMFEGAVSDEARDETVHDRLRPAFAVYTREAELAEAAAAVEEPVEEPIEEPIVEPVEEPVDEPIEEPIEEPAPDRVAEGAFGGTMDGEAIYQQACAVCHVAGVAGAPRLVAEDWTERLEKGFDELVANSISGIGAMPPRGGRGDLTDEQVEVAVRYMLDELD